MFGTATERSGKFRFLISDHFELRPAFKIGNHVKIAAVKGC